MTPVNYQVFGPGAVLLKLLLLTRSFFYEPLSIFHQKQDDLRPNKIQFFVATVLAAPSSKSIPQIHSITLFMWEIALKPAFLDSLKWLFISLDHISNTILVPMAMRN